MRNCIPRCVFIRSDIQGVKEKEKREKQNHHGGSGGCPLKACKCSSDIGQ